VILAPIRIAFHSRTLFAPCPSLLDKSLLDGAPFTYVKVCDAYGAGFYTIPGTETCIKVGGRVRADYAFSGKADQNATNVFAVTGQNAVGGYYYNNALTASVSSTVTSATPYNGGVIGTPNVGTATAAGTVAANGLSKKATNLYGWEARARVDLDARTATPYGTVQAVASLRLSRTTGVLLETGPNLSATSASPTLEAAYIRFAGFTFGAARDNFSFMPSVFYGAGHWSSFANGAKQLAYTAVLGGGFSATLAIQDAADTTAGGVNALGTVSAGTGGYAQGVLVAPAVTAAEGANNGTIAYSYHSIPQINGRVDFDQAWGTVTVIGAVGQAVAVNTAGTYDKTKTTYAVGAGAKLNLPQIAAGDTLWVNGGYAQGITEYTTNWTSFKSSDTRRNVGGYVVNHPSWIVTSGGLELIKSWNVAAVFQHFWAPQWRHSFLASYGQVDGTSTSKSLAWSQTGAFGDAKVWNVGTQLAFVPTKDFEIGVDVLYARVAQDIRRLDGTTTAGGSAGNWNNTGAYTSTVTNEKTGNWTGRLRVERTF